MTKPIHGIFLMSPVAHKRSAIDDYVRIATDRELFTATEIRVVDRDDGTQVVRIKNQVCTRTYPVESVVS